MDRRGYEGRYDTKYSGIGKIPLLVCGDWGGKRLTTRIDTVRMEVDQAPLG